MPASWPARAAKFMAALKLDAPIVQAPMASAIGWAGAAGAARAGALGSVPCAMLAPEAVVDEAARFRSSAPGRALNLNFFTTHDAEKPTLARMEAWVEALGPCYAAAGVAAPEPSTLIDPGSRAPFGEGACAALEEVRPEVASFHFGLPSDALLDRVRAAGCQVWCSATSLAEAEALLARGVDAVIAQGWEAGGHRGTFLGSYRDPPAVGTHELVPRIVDVAGEVLVIAAGGIADGRGVAAALALGASAVQIGTAFLTCDDATATDKHKKAVARVRDGGTVVTNVFSGRPARGVANALTAMGPISSATPEFPWAGKALGPLQSADDDAYGGGYWCGTSAHVRPPAGDVESVARWLGEGAARALDA